MKEEAERGREVPGKWRGDKGGFTCQVERSRVGQRGAGRKEAGREKVDLPVAQLLATRSLYYLLRLESPVSQGRIVEEAKYVTGDRQVSDRAGGGEVLWGFQRERRKKKLFQTLLTLLISCFKIDVTLFWGFKNKTRGSSLYGCVATGLGLFRANIKVSQAWRKSWHAELGAVDFVRAVFAIFDWWCWEKYLAKCNEMYFEQKKTLNYFISYFMHCIFSYVRPVQKTMGQFV